MKTRLLLCTCAISILAFTAGTAYSCGQNPVASFTVYPNRVCINGVVSFDASASYDPDETTLSYSWSFGAGAYAITGATTASPTCKYSSPGEKTVTLTVTDNDDPEYCGGQPGCADKSDSISSYPFTVVKVDKIQYWNPDTLYTDITETLYICVGSTVPFRAVPDPSTSYWPTGKPVWGGTAGASGSGIGIKSVEFNTVSSTLADYKTVTAECGNTVTVNVIVFDFCGVMTPQDDFPGGSGTRYGVYERVNLSCEIVPAGVTPAQVGGLRWSRHSGIGSVTNITDSGTALYIAGQYAGTVTLRLTVLSGPSKGTYRAYTRTIVEPDGGVCVKRSGTNIWHVWNSFSIGVNTYMYLRPTDVSFKWIEFSEGGCYSQETGWFTNQFTGTGHNPWTEWKQVGGGDATTGCQILQPNGDFAELWHYTPFLPYSYGTLLWNIPWRYRAGDYTTTFTYMNQEFRVYYDGRAEVRKDDSGWFYNYHGWPTLLY